LFTLDIFGGWPEWERNLEVARLVGAKVDRAVIEAGKNHRKKRTALIDGLPADNEKRLRRSLPSLLVPAI
jgi:hypothetical protein